MASANYNKSGFRAQQVSAATLREYFHYNPDTGELIRKKRTSPSTKVGDRVGCLAASGHVVFTLFSRTYLVHRVAWAIHYGRWPEKDIDHHNGDPADNRICNLREVTHQENHRNCKRSKNNSSGFNGVYKYDNVWCAEIMVDYKKIWLGRFTNKQDAIAARQAANVKYGFTDRHGL